MSEETKPEQTELPIETPADDTAAKEVEALRAETLKAKKEAQRIQQELEAQKNKNKELQMQGLKAKEDYKALYETEKQSREQIEKELNVTRAVVTDSTKWNAVSKELLTLGINPAALKDAEKIFDLSEIEIETTSHGRYQVLNAKEAAERFKARSPYLFTGHQKPNVNSGIPTVITPGSVTLELVTNLEKEWKKNRTPETQKKYEDALRALKRQGMQ